jgi:pimeloyl-ACP methyl ester carboxylesterase
MRLSVQEGEQYQLILEYIDQPGSVDKAGMFARLGELAGRADQYDPLPEPLTRPGASQPDPQSSHGNPFHQVLKEAQELRQTGQLLKTAASIRCPVVALHGAYDPHPVAGVEVPLSNHLKDFRMICLDKCGHKPWIERQARDRFYQVLKAELHAP